MRHYTRFRKKLLGNGYYQLQESVYVGRFHTKEQIEIFEKTLILIAPSKSSVRGLTLTHDQFLKIKVLSGEMSFGEEVVRKKKGLIEI